MLFSKQPIIAVCLCLSGISSTTTAIPNANAFLSDHQKEETTNVNSFANAFPLRTSRELRSGGKKGKKYTPPPSQCSDFDIDSLLFISVNADFTTFSSDFGQQDAFGDNIGTEYNDLASGSCGDDALFLENVVSTLKTGDLTAIQTRRVLHKFSSSNHRLYHGGRRLESQRRIPDVTTAYNTKGRCNRCRRGKVIRPDILNRHLLFLEEMETTTTSNMHASSSGHHHQRQTTEGKKRGDRSGQVADASMLGKSGKKDREEMDMGGKAGGKGDGEPSLQLTVNHITSGKKSSKSPNGKKGEDSMKGKKGSSGTKGKKVGESTATEIDMGPSGKLSMGKTTTKNENVASSTESSSSESTPSSPFPVASSSPKSGKKGKKVQEPEVCCEPPSGSDLSTALNNALRENSNAVPSISNVNEIIELTPVECDDEVTTLHGVVTIEHEASQLKPQELELLAETFIDAYNQANSLSIDICDPSFRAVTDCHVVEPYVPPVGKSSKSGKSGKSGNRRYLNKGKSGKYAPVPAPPTSSTVVLEYHYTAKCRGCTAGSKIFEATAAGRNLEKYGGASSSQGGAPVFAGDHRQLSEIIQARCFCPPVPPAESRGPNTSEFADIFADLFDFLRVEGGINYIESVGAVSEH